jgi:hypothetical protein
MVAPVIFDCPGFDTELATTRRQHDWLLNGDCRGGPTAAC